MDQLSSLFGLCQQPSQQQQQQQQSSTSTSTNDKFNIFVDDSAAFIPTSPSSLSKLSPSTIPTTSAVTTIFGSQTINTCPSSSSPTTINLWDLTTNRNEIYPGEVSISSTTTTTTPPPPPPSTINSNNLPSPAIKLTSKSCKLSSSKKPKSALHINTTPTITTSIIVKPILKSSSSLLSSHHSSRHKRCSSLGQSIRYIDETTPSNSFSPFYHLHHHHPPSGSPLASLTCPSTPNAYTTNVPIQSAFPAFTGMQLSTSTPDQHQPSTPLSAITNGRCVNCGSSFSQFNESDNENNSNSTAKSASTQIDSGSISGQLWTYQRSMITPSSSPTTYPLDPSTCDHLIHPNNQRNQSRQSNQHSSHYHQNRSSNNLDSNASLLPTLASVESATQQFNPTDSTNNNPASHQNHNHLHNKSFRSYHHPHHHHHHHHETTDRQSLYSIHMEKDFRYFFQHPYARLLVAYSVIACNFLIFAEDPISHSHTECGLPIVGNVVSFVFTRYPPETPWKVIKVICWLTALAVGMVTGKYLVHHILLRRILRLKMFRDEEGTWMIMILVTFICTYLFSLGYNLLLLSAHPTPKPYLITTLMGVTNSSFMKAAACGTWLGDFFTAWMVTDMMLQDELYPGWAKGLRSFLMRHGHIRIIIFWTGSIGVSSLVIYMISSDEISWDNLNHNYVNTTELTRAFLASMILVMDLLVVMQDWDFPHFVCDMDIKLPGLKQASYSFKIFTIKKTLSLPETFVFHITGKWFNYGIIIVVMMLDLNMWKNQIIYYPPDFGQYTGPDMRVYTVADESILSTGNSSLWTYSVRTSTYSELTNRSLMEGDLVVNSRYLNYSIYVKSLAFLPCAAGFVLFFTLIYQYGRFPPKTDASHGGRLKKRKSTSSWRRERRDSRHGYISWKGITTYEEEATSLHRQLEENSNV